MKYSNISAFAIGVFLSILLLFLLEGLFGLLIVSETKPRSIMPKPQCSCSDIKGKIYKCAGTVNDDTLAYKNTPNTQCKVTKINSKGQVIFDHKCSCDDYGRRMVSIMHSIQPKKSILFFGCSFTFGTGVNDNETMPYYVSKLAGEYKVYNYGVRGYGPAQMLIRLQRDNLKDEIQENSPILLYTFFDDHINRVIGSSSFTAQGGPRAKYFPNFKLVKDELVYKGRFSDRKFTTLIYGWFVKSNIVKYFKLNLPYIVDKHIKLTARILEESKDLFKDQFKSDDFYVLIYPHASSRYRKKLIECLKSANIKYLDYSNLINNSPHYRKMPRSVFFIPGDSHPTPKLHKIIAKQIVSDLSL